MRAPEIEKIFVQAVIDLKQILVLDGIDIQPDNASFRVRCQGLHGPLPEIVIRSSGNTFQDKDRLGNETCKLIANVRLRDRMCRWLSGGKLLAPTKLDTLVIVGFQVGTKTWIVAGNDFITAYHGLHEQVVG